MGYDTFSIELHCYPKKAKRDEVLRTRSAFTFPPTLQSNPGRK